MSLYSFIGRIFKPWSNVNSQPYEDHNKNTDEINQIKSSVITDSTRPIRIKIPLISIFPTTPFLAISASSDVRTANSGGNFSFSTSTSPAYDTGSNFSIDHYTVPSSGVYWFEFSLLITCSANGTYHYGANIVNETPGDFYGNILEFFVGKTGDVKTLTYATAINATAGDIIDVNLTNHSDSTTVTVTDRSFSGYRVA